MAAGPSLSSVMGRLQAYHPPIWRPNSFNGCTRRLPLGQRPSRFATTVGSRKKRNVAESRTYEDEVLAVLAYEFSPDDRADSDRKIKRRLREKKLGKFEPQRIEVLRAF